MQITKDAPPAVAATTHRDAGDTRAILYQANTGVWELNLPARLRDHQTELEALLAKVFAGKQSQDNLELAQQLTINWCMSKCRKLGLPERL